MKIERKSEMRQNFLKIERSKFACSVAWDSYQTRLLLERRKEKNGNRKNFFRSLIKYLIKEELSEPFIPVCSIVSDYFTS
jgi:hypothetical protein